MANGYLPVERDQVFLLPPDMREWLSEDHLAWFVLEVLERVDTSVLHDRRRLGGRGRRGYDPDMLLALLVYAYCTGQRSSRQIERLCEVDVAYRVIWGGNAPDHTTIARFRQDHEAHAARLFADVLMLCAQAGLATVGVVAVDGTKMAADASGKVNATREQVEEAVRVMLAEADQVDAAQDRLFGDDRGDELPPDLRGRGQRGKRLDAALAELARREQAQCQADADVAAARGQRVAAARAQGRKPRGVAPAVTAVAEERANLDGVKQEVAQRRAALEARYAAQGRKPPGFAPSKPKEIAQAEAVLARAEQRATVAAAAAPDKPERVNLTDPDSRVMSTAKGWVQGYNAQAAVNDTGVVIAADVVQDGNDCEQLVPMIAEIDKALDVAGISDEVGTLLFDAGYWSEANATAPGPDRLIATTKDWKRRKQLRQQGAVTGPPPDDATPQEAMEHRLCTAEGAALYAQRAQTVEPVFGAHKHNRGFRRFRRRGLDAVKAEWLLINATSNLMKVFNHQAAAAGA
jgi:transposase